METATITARKVLTPGRLRCVSIETAKTKLSKAVTMKISAGKFGLKFNDWNPKTG